MPRSERSLMSSQKRRREAGSTPPVGSSRKTIRGSWRTAQPRARRCFQPTERVRVRLRSRPSRPAISRTQARRVSTAFFGQAVGAAEEADVLDHGQVLVERELLRHVADRPLDALGLAADVEAADRRRPGGRVEEAAEHADGRGLAGSVGPEKAEDPAAVDIEGDRIDGREVAEPLRERLDLDRMFGHGAPVLSPDLSSPAPFPAGPGPGRDRSRPGSGTSSPGAGRPRRRGRRR